jgi:hypothetical protein
VQGCRILVIRAIFKVVVDLLHGRNEDLGDDTQFRNVESPNQFQDLGYFHTPKRFGGERLTMKGRRQRGDLPLISTVSNSPNRSRTLIVDNGLRSFRYSADSIAIVRSSR